MDHTNEKKRKQLKENWAKEQKKLVRYNSTCVSQREHLLAACKLTRVLHSPVHAACAIKPAVIHVMCLTLAASLTISMQILMRTTSLLPPHPHRLAKDKLG